LAAFNKLSELKGRTVHLALSCQNQPQQQLENRFENWNQLCGQYNNVKFIAPSKVVYLFDLIQQYPFLLMEGSFNAQLYLTK